MKKIKFRLLLIAVSIICMCFCLSPKTSAIADTPSGSLISINDMDSNLYVRLKQNNERQTLRSDSFLAKGITFLDLTGPKTIDTSNNIKDISGLTLFRLETITKIDLSYNSISEIPTEIWGALPNLEELILTENDLTHIDVTGLSKLTKLTVISNNLQSANLLDMDPNNSVIDLSNNSIKSASDLELPYSASTNVELKLYNNLILDYTNNSLPTGYTARLGLQGINKNGKIEKSNSPIYYKTGDDLKVKIYIKSGNETIYAIYDPELTNLINPLDLDYANYKIEYYYVLNDDSEGIISIKNSSYNPGAAYAQGKDYFNNFKYAEFALVPTLPTYKFVIGGEEKSQGEAQKITKKCSINLYADEGTKIYYKMSTSSDWVEGSTINVTKGGRYYIEIKSVSLDGQFTSNSNYIYINGASSLVVPDILIILGIILFIVLVIVVIFPLLKKYVL